MRPANIVTAIADILAGVAVAYGSIGSIDNSGYSNLFLLIVATVGLYGGGVVFNDVFDAELDRIERPERPIPRGDISIKSAALLAILLYLVAILSAFTVSIVSGAIAIIVACLATFYDKYGKHMGAVGPLAMGSCRAGNLMLGVSARPDMVFEYSYLMLLPFLFNAQVTANVFATTTERGRRAKIRRP